MSLARNPNMAYAVAGEQQGSFEKMYVHRNVRVPNAEARDGAATRKAYQAPAYTGSRHGDFRISMKVVVLLSALVLFVMAMCYISAVAERSELYKKRQQIIDEIQATQKSIIVLEEEVAKVRQSSRICYQAVQRLGMVSCQGVERIEIFAPETRPVQTASSLAEGSMVAWGTP